MVMIKNVLVFIGIISQKIQYQLTTTSGDFDNIYYQQTFVSMVLI